MRKPLFDSVAEAEAHNRRVQQGNRDRRARECAIADGYGPHTIDTMVDQGEVSDPARPTSFTIITPWPPTLNHSGLDGFRGGRKTPEYKAFMDNVVLLVLAQRIQPLKGRLSCRIVAFPPDRRGRDIDNIVKPILDAMQRAGCYANDEAIDHIEITRVRDCQPGTVSVTVSEIDHFLSVELKRQNGY